MLTRQFAAKIASEMRQGPAPVAMSASEAGYVHIELCRLAAAAAAQGDEQAAMIWGQEAERWVPFTEAPYLLQPLRHR